MFLQKAFGDLVFVLIQRAASAVRGYARQTETLAYTLLEVSELACIHSVESFLNRMGIFAQQLQLVIESNWEDRQV